LARVLIAALQQYQAEAIPSNTTPNVDVATPDGAGDTSEPVPVIDTLLGDSDPEV
jgi:hypothetical protein